MTTEDRTLVREIACMAGSLWYLTVRACLRVKCGSDLAATKEFADQGEKALQTFWRATGEAEAEEG